MTSPSVSVILPTYNRSAGVLRALDSALDQIASPRSYEIIVVDNNSTDDTPQVAERAAREHQGRVRWIRELRQGVAYARQAGIDAAAADILAFFDDDVRVSREWVATIQRYFREDPDVECLGGKVLPEWSAPPPRWLTTEHWAPLALQDFGNEPMVVSLENPRGLISANLACRRSLVERIGGFSPLFQRVKDGIGSLEDDEWIRRVWRAGARTKYVPDLVAWTEVPPARLTKAYHRRWHQGHGGFYALLRAEEMERTSMGTLLGVPAHLYRTALRDAARWMSSYVSARPDRAFAHEIRLRFFAGFFGRRVRQPEAPAGHLRPTTGI
jgi:glycosyltransferase involved in cell wall biosynthesis